MIVASVLACIRVAAITFIGQVVVSDEWPQVDGAMSEPVIAALLRGGLDQDSGHLGLPGAALIIVPAVGWTSASAVHRIPRRRWWTALRLSTLRCPAAGTVIKAPGA